MNFVTIKLTVKELELLTDLAADQMFRREFIEPKMPGYKSNVAEISLGKVLIARLQSIQVSGPSKRTQRTSKRVT